MLKHAKNLFYSPYVRHYATGTEKPASSIPTLAKLGFTNLNVLRNLSVGELYKIGVSRIPPVDPNTKLTTISSTGALCAYSGIKTGRSPKDKRVVQDENSKDVWWGPVNFPLTPKSYELVEERAIAYLNTRPRLYVVDGYAGWDPRYRITIRVVCSRAYHALFMRNMLIVPTPEELARDFSGEVDFHVINAGEFPATPSVDGVATKTCIAVNLTQRRMSILGTQYAGEMKKGVFGVMHYLMPKKGVLSLHASANEGEKGDVTLLFGLSGTGKTTLSADPKRKLIGDDEHCWTPDGVFNIEGGCYAKCVNLSAEKEPEIYNAIRFGSILENVLFTDDVNREVNYEDISITENTRATYPLQYIPNCKIPAVGGHPKNIFFLTCDAYGVLPPVAKLNHAQAMYHFISGYTAKVAGTEIGVKEPQATFSACFGEVFLPLHPTVYAEMLAEKMNKHGANAWLINTGWSGGKYGEGKRMDLKVTRAIIDAIHSGELEKVPTKKMDLFGLQIPETCPGVPSEMLNPKNTWKNKSDYDKTAQSLAALFVKNFDKYADKATKETKAAGPQLN